MPLSECVYCVAVAFKLTEQVEQQICLKFCVKLEHSRETIWMIQKATAMGNRWWAASSRQRTRSCITSHTEFLMKHQITQLTLPPYSTDLVPYDFWIFPKLKYLWKGRDFRLLMRFRKIQWGSWWWLGDLCKVPKCLPWQGLRCHCPMLQCFSYLVSSSVNVSIFHSTWLDTFWTDLICLKDNSKVPIPIQIYFIYLFNSLFLNMLVFLLFFLFAYFSWSKNIVLEIRSFQIAKGPWVPAWLPFHTSS